MAVVCCRCVLAKSCLRAGKLARLRYLQRPRAFSGTCSNSSLQVLRHPAATGEVFLVGTSHISTASADQVHEVVKAVRPDHVVVELCEPRRRQLESQRASGAHSNDGAGGVLQAFLRGFRIPGVDPAGGAFMGAISGFYAALRGAGLDPGVDMLAGIDAGREAGAEIVCGDVPAEETARRLRGEVLSTDLPALLAAMNSPEVQRKTLEMGMDQLVDVAALLRGDPGASSGFEAFAEKLKDRNKVRSMIELMDAAAPRLVAVLLHNRDSHIAKLLRSPPLHNQRTVCVVGLAHMDGISRRYLDPSWHGDPPLPDPPHMSSEVQSQVLRTLMAMLSRIPR